MASAHAGLTVPRSVILDALDLAGLDEDALYEDYSGRGMYGRACFGVVVKGVAQAALFAAAFASLAKWEDLMRDAASDEMALNIILYFPHYTVSDD